MLYHYYCYFEALKTTTQSPRPHICRRGIRYLKGVLVEADFEAGVALAFENKNVLKLLEPNFSKMDSKIIGRIKMKPL